MAAAGSFECSAPSAGTRPRRLTLRCARSQRVTGAAASSLRDQFGRRWAQNRRASFKTKESGKLKYGVLEAGNRPAMPLLRLGRVGSRPEDLSASKNGSVKTCHPSLPLPKSLYPQGTANQSQFPESQKLGRARLASVRNAHAAASAAELALTSYLQWQLSTCNLQ